MKHLAGKKALVTGAAGGIGRAISLELAKQGVTLALVDNNPFGLASVRRDVESLGVEAIDYTCDVTNRQEVSAVTNGLLNASAGVDLLINNAGITYHGATHTMPTEEWDRLLAVNLESHLQFTRELLPAMLARPEAHILNVCSMLGLSGMPRVTAYCTTKFAMVGFSQSLRAEYGRVGLGVTALCPGFVDTGLFGAARPETEGNAPKAPPKWLCITPDLVARKAVRAIKRNQQQVTIDPRGGLIYRAKWFMPRLFDSLLAIGRSKRIKKKTRELEALSTNQTEAIKLKLGLDDQQAEVTPKRMAA